MTINNHAGPRVFLLDAERLLETRRRVFLADAALQAADERLLQDADQALQVGPFSVVDKEVIPPSGDKRDYLSQAPYWWRDPDSPDGLPYIRRDGQVNPASRELDHARLGAMCSAVNALALAYFFSDHEMFAERAALLLRCWFLDESTRMNPHLEYGQGIPGYTSGRRNGIIDTSQFSWLVDAVALLGESSAWNGEDEQQLQAWFSAYLDWLLTSEHGRREANQANHHGTWYDVQVCCLALCVGRHEVARRVLEESAKQRIAGQVGADGRQKCELARTCSLDFCSMNLAAFFDLAVLGERIGLDLWRWEAGESGSVERAFYWLVEAAVEAEEWAYEQIVPFDGAKLLPLLRQGGLQFSDARCEAWIEGLEGVDSESDRTNLLYATEK